MSQQTPWPLARADSLGAVPARRLRDRRPAGPDPTQVKINDIDERLGRVERVVSNQSLLTSVAAHRRARSAVA